MPLYEYECERCGKRLEVIQKFSDEPLTLCAACGGTMHRLLSSPAVQFKGTGWYVTDYARKSAPASADDANRPKDAVSGKEGDKPSPAEPAKETKAATDPSPKPPSAPTD